VVNRYLQAMGVVERTSAEVADGPWVPGLQTQLGYLMAIDSEGVAGAAFEVAPGQIALSFDREQVISARRVASGLNVIVDADIRADDGNSVLTVTFIGPRGRMKRIFAFLGHPL